jgi:hypothetical protein
VLVVSLIIGKSCATGHLMTCKTYSFFKTILLLLYITGFLFWYTTNGIHVKPLDYLHPQLQYHSAWNFSKRICLYRTTRLRNWVVSFCKVLTNEEDTQYFVANFLNNKIIQSNDIESNPGPARTIHPYAYVKEQVLRHDKNLKYIHINAQNLSIKYSEFKQLIEDMGSNTIVAISETWFDESDDSRQWVINKDIFEIYRCDRNHEENG